MIDKMLYKKKTFHRIAKTIYRKGIHCISYKEALKWDFMISQGKLETSQGLVVGAITHAEELRKMVTKAIYKMNRRIEDITFGKPKTLADGTKLWCILSHSIPELGLATFFTETREHKNSYRIYKKDTMLKEFNYREELEHELKLIACGKVKV